MDMVCVPTGDAHQSREIWLISMSDFSFWTKNVEEETKDMLVTLA